MFFSADQEEQPHAEVEQGRRPPWMRYWTATGRFIWRSRQLDKDFLTRIPQIVTAEELISSIFASNVNVNESLGTIGMHEKVSYIHTVHM